MLLDSNIMVVDALNRQFSLPYEHFRRWPLMLAHLQCEFKGLPGESHISRNKFGLFRAAKRPQNEVMIPFEQWENSVFPGDRFLMSIDIEQLNLNKCPSCGCSLLDVKLIPAFSEWFVTLVPIALSIKLTIASAECGQSVLTMRNDLNDKVFSALPTYCPEIEGNPWKKAVEMMDIQRFARVHGRHRNQPHEEPIAMDLYEEEVEDIRAWIKARGESAAVLGTTKQFRNFVTSQLHKAYPELSMPSN